MAARSEAEASQVFDLGYPGLQPGVVHSEIFDIFVADWDVGSEATYEERSRGRDLNFESCIEGT